MLKTIIKKTPLYPTLISALKYYNNFKGKIRNLNYRLIGVFHGIDIAMDKNNCAASLS